VGELEYELIYYQLLTKDFIVQSSLQSNLELRRQRTKNACIFARNETGLSRTLFIFSALWNDFLFKNCHITHYSLK
jgi:hypothetical protein